MNIYFKIKRLIACLLIRDQKTLNIPEALVSFSFDDVPNSAFVNGKSLLGKYAYSATYYISIGLHDELNPVKGYFDTRHLKDVVAEGGELACHTYSHLHLYKASAKELSADLDLNQQKLTELIPGYTFRNFSYPYGEQTYQSKRILRKRFSSARSVQSGINSNPVDTNNLKAVALVSSLPLKQVFAYIDQVISQKGWLIFYTHDVDINPSVWGCSPAYFEQVLSYCSQKKVKVLTIEKVLGNSV